MNSPSNQMPPVPDDPHSEAVDEPEVLLDYVDYQSVGRIAHPPEQGVEVVPSGNFPPAAAPRQVPMPAPRPARAGASDGETEIISVLPDPSAPRRRRPRNRKAPSPAKLLGLFLAAQVVVGLLGFAIFGGMIRSWMMKGAIAPDGVTAKEAAALRDNVEQAKAGFDQFDKDLALVKKRIAVSPGDAWAELELLGKRNELTMLADDAIANGTRAAFDRLEAKSEDASADQRLRNGAAAEILRVKDFYASHGTRFGSYALPVATLYPSLRTKAEAELETPQLISLLGNQERSWKVRTRAAFLLASRRELAVCEALVQAAKTDPNLDVVKECVATFEENTGYRAKGLFEIEELESWWTVYEARVSLAAERPDPG